MLIRLWMRTAVRKEVTSFGTFLNTLCHEFCHHLDFHRFGFPTRGIHGASTSVLPPFTTMREEHRRNNCFGLRNDNVDPEYIEKPKRWDISFIRRFMVTLGPVSSLFDFVTFFTMLFVFQAVIAPKSFQSVFQTAWFTESLCSQTLVVLIIRTQRIPFYKSKPSKYLTVMLLVLEDSP